MTRLKFHSRLNPYLRHIDTLNGLCGANVFYREAKMEYATGRYIIRFSIPIHYRGIVGNGKWRKEAVVKNSRISGLFRVSFKRSSTK